MDVAVKDDPEQARYEVRVDGQLAGFAQYRLNGRHITFFHTEVEPEYEGAGFGSRLAQEALDDVRARHLSVVPLCPFIAAYIRRHADDYIDLVVPGMRERITENG